MSTEQRPEILVVDDDQGMLRALSRVLTPHYAIEQAASVREAREVLGKFSFDIALIDIRLPDGDGYNLFREVRAAHPDTDVILMTGSTTEPDEKLYRALVEDAFYFFFKPIERRVLLALVDRCLRLRKAQRENRRHVQRLTQDLQKARRLQLSLLPAVPLTHSGWLADGRWRSCETIGGDGYSLLTLGDRLLFSLSDVTGHGVRAAMYIGMLTSVLRAAQRLDATPEYVLGHLLRTVDFLAPPDMASMVYGALSPEGACRFFSAGHPDILWLRQNTVHRLSSTGPLLMAIDLGIPTTIESINVEPGDRLLIYSDGITEAKNPKDEEFGLAKLAAVFAQTSQEPVSEALDAIERAVAEHLSQRPPQDDATLVMIEREKAE